MDKDKLDRSDDIRQCIYYLSEGDPLADDENDILQADAKVFVDIDHEDDEHDSSDMFDILAKL